MSGQAFDLELRDFGYEGGLGRVERFVPVNIDEEELVHAGDEGAEVCLNCHGSGDDEYIVGGGKSWHDCATCGGSGWV
jgi:hypothetical protein